MLIKKIDLSDKTLANQLLAVSLLAYKEESKIINYPQLPPLKENVVELMQSKTDFFGCFCGEKLVGAIELESKNSAIWICRLVVRPDYFQQGIASKLLAKILDDHATFFVGTAEKNRPAINLYTKFGFHYKETKVVGLPPIHWNIYCKH